MEAGGDMAKPMGVDTIPEIKRAMREIPGPHMATLSQAAGPKARSLEGAGSRRRGCRDLPVAAAVRGGEQGCATSLRTLKAKNSLCACKDHVLTLEEYYDLVGLKPMLAREEAYDKAAAALVQKRAAE